MGHISESIDIDAPLETCWALNADASKLTQWNPAILEVRDVTGPLDRVGTTYTGVIKAMGRRFDGKNQVTAVDPQKSVDTAGTGMGGAKARVHVDFARRGAGTRVTVTIDYDLPGGLFGGIAEKLFATRQLEDQLKTSNAGFKALAEKEAKLGAGVGTSGASPATAAPGEAAPGAGGSF